MRQMTHMRALVPDNYVPFPEQDQIVTIDPASAEWPEQLNELGGARPPERLYRLGQPIDPDAQMVAVVGTRAPTMAGIEIARELTKGLVEARFVVVSGFAVG
nr:DNA-protecting protein DprA [Actinomycetota bacterium]